MAGISIGALLGVGLVVKIAKDLQAILNQSDGDDESA